MDFNVITRTMTEGIKNISIAKIKELGFPDVKVYGDELVLGNQLNHLNVFRQPCRIDGVVVFVCLAGSICCNVNLRPYTLSAGDMLVNFTSSTIHAQPLSEFKAMAGLVSYSYLDKLQIRLNDKLSFYMGVRSNAVTHLPIDELNSYELLFSLLERGIDDTRPGQDSIMDSLIQLLGKMLVRSAQSFAGDTAGENKPVRSEQIFERFMELVTKFKGAKRSALFFAGEMGLTPNYLSSMVKSCSGRSAAEWINDYTVSEAKVMLRFSDMSVQQIATSLSFPSQSAFGKFFKQHVGVSPNQFRKNS